MDGRSSRYFIIPGRSPSLAMSINLSTSFCEDDRGLALEDTAEVAEEEEWEEEEGVGWESPKEEEGEIFEDADNNGVNDTDDDVADDD